MLKGRDTKKAFYGIPAEGGSGTPTYTRMKYFTDFSISKNPTEYSRRYIDEKTERSDVVGYAPSISYSFDEYSDDAVLSDIVSISDGELVGSDTHREIVLVDFSKKVEGGYFAIKRTFAVIPDSEGDSTDAYTYSGSLKAVGEITKGVAAISDPADGTSETVNAITFTKEITE